MKNIIIPKGDTLTGSRCAAICARVPLAVYDIIEKVARKTSRTRSDVLARVIIQVAPYIVAEGDEEDESCA